MAIVPCGWEGVAGCFFSFRSDWLLAPDLPPPPWGRPATTEGGHTPAPQVSDLFFFWSLANPPPASGLEQKEKTYFVSSGAINFFFPRCRHPVAVIPESLHQWHSPTSAPAAAPAYAFDNKMLNLSPIFAVGFWPFLIKKNNPLPRRLSWYMKVWSLKSRAGLNT